MVPAPYLAVVSPDAPAGSLVYKLHAQDGDEGNNGEVEYFLSDGRLLFFSLLHFLSFNIFIHKMPFFLEFFFQTPYLDVKVGARILVLCTLLLNVEIVCDKLYLTL